MFAVVRDDNNTIIDFQAEPIAPEKLQELANSLRCVCYVIEYTEVPHCVLPEEQ